MKPHSASIPDFYQGGHSDLHWACNKNKVLCSFKQLNIGLIYYCTIISSIPKTFCGEKCKSFCAS